MKALLHVMARKVVKRIGDGANDVGTVTGDVGRRVDMYHPWCQARGKYALLALLAPITSRCVVVRGFRNPPRGRGVEDRHGL